LLLYAMQHPARRSLRAVARALARAEAALRRWAKGGDWYARIEGPETESYAIAGYRLLYLRDHGQTEIPEVSSRMTLPIDAKAGAKAPLPEVIEDVRAASQDVAREVGRRADGARAIREKHVRLIDAGIGYIVEQLKAGKVRASLGDLDTLLKARARIDGEPTDAPAGAASFESARVRAAREGGHDVLAAVEADLGELAVILAALKTRRAAGELDGGYRLDDEADDGLRVVRGGGG
jgi:hypothetical protein